MTDDRLQPLELDRRSADVVVIGAGVIGLAVALRLQAQGRQVLLLDREGLGAGASRGNAGALAFSDVLPLASPGILRQAPRWLLDPLGPLSLRPAYLLPMLPWLWRFWRASRPQRVQASTRAQAALMKLSRAEWPELLALAGASDCVREGGNLHLYDSEASWRASLPGWQVRAEHGIAFEHLRGREALAAWQPGLSERFEFGSFVPAWQTVDDPLRMLHRLAQALQQRGGLLRQARVAALQPGFDAMAVQLEGESVTVQARRVVVCAGAWSHRLAANLGEDFPLETERGYNTTLPADAFPLQRQLTFCDHGFVVTPLSTGVRVGGAVEFAGLDAAPNFERSRTMLDKARRFLPALRTEGGAAWMGCRPSLPDSLPVLGVSRRDPRVFHAFGHGHLGLTQAAATARVVADWMAARPPALDLSAFAPQRFTR